MNFDNFSKKTLWIRHPHSHAHDYNITTLLLKKFVVRSQKQSSTLKICADSFYRVKINGKWIGDGPARAYPEHTLFDKYDISSVLRKGTNTVEIITRYFGTGTFHQIPQQPGLIAELRTGNTTIGTDSSWLCKPLPAWRKWTPKISIQMEPVEDYDARLENNSHNFLPAEELFGAEHGPWKNLKPRSTAQMTRIPVKAIRLLSANIMKKQPDHVCVPVTQIAHPGVIEANHYTSRPVLLASVLDVTKSGPYNFSSPNWLVTVDGSSPETGKIHLKKGHHLVIFFCSSFFGHNKELPFPFYRLKNSRWMNPTDPLSDDPWAVAVLSRYIFRGTDINWLSFPNPPADKIRIEYFKEINKLAKKCRTTDNFKRIFGNCIREDKEPPTFMSDFTAGFASGKKAVKAEAQILNGSAVCKAGRGFTVIRPSEHGNPELCYDLGKQYCGYFNFELESEADVEIEIHGIEYISPSGRVQHTADYNRNGMRYITKKGLNKFTSLKRRSGRYVFLTFRNLHKPVILKKLNLIKSTAPVNPVSLFKTSDGNLNRIWEICEHTLKLCMEDVFTDCPLYEQTLWIGDARNEALYAFHTYGNYNVSARSIELGAQSLDHFPIVGCQVPSSWQCLLPAWSFLWGIHIWEHFFHSGDKAFLRKMWPAVLRNMEGAYKFINRHGLFSAPMWNLLEWAPIDQNHATVTHNSLLLVGALSAAIKCAETLGKTSDLKILKSKHRCLIKNINLWWDNNKQTYPDAILGKGSASRKTCQHTSMLAIIFDVLPAKHISSAIRNLLNPPANMTRIGSPFAMQFMYEALERSGEYDAILESIRKNYMPMLKAGATTAWETFADSTCSPKEFPTRSHCHAWSCSPLHFLPRIVLGIRQTEPGGRCFEISPWIKGITKASGGVATPFGSINVNWFVKKNTLKVEISAPKEIHIVFKHNASNKQYLCRLIRHHIQQDT